MRFYRYGAGPLPHRSSPPFRKIFLFLMLFFFFLSIAQGKPGVLFLVFPFFMIWFAFSIFSLLFRSFVHGARRIEEFWTEHLDDDSVSVQRVEPESADSGGSLAPADVVTPYPRLSGVWNTVSQNARSYFDDSELRRPTRALLRQVYALCELYERFQKLLSKRLSPDELTHRRFLSAGQQSFELITEELEKVVGRLEQLISVEESLHPTADGVETQQLPFQGIRSEQLSKIDAMLSQTRDAIAQMARVNLAISEMRITSAAKKGNIQQAVDQLKDLAERAKQF